MESNEKLLQRNNHLPELHVEHNNGAHSQPEQGGFQALKKQHFLQLITLEVVCRTVLFAIDVSKKPVCMLQLRMQTKHSALSSKFLERTSQKSQTETFRYAPLLAIFKLLSVFIPIFNFNTWIVF